MNARQGWTPAKQEVYDLMGPEDCDPITYRDALVALRDDLGAIDRLDQVSQPDYHAMVSRAIDLAANAIELRDQLMALAD